MYIRQSTEFLQINKDTQSSRKGVQRSEQYLTEEDI